MEPKDLENQLRLNDYLLERNLDEVTTDLSVAYPTEGNCINWNLGHVVMIRHQAIALLGGALGEAPEYEPYLDDEARSLPAGPHLSVPELARRFGALGERIAELAGSVPADHWDAPAPFSPVGDPEETIRTLIGKLWVHEAYHLGQIAALRRALGLPGRVKRPNPDA